MIPAVRSTPFHPRWYRRRVSVWWWLEKRSYTLFVLRELTSVFVALFAALTLWQVRALAAGPEAWGDLAARLRAPGFLALNAVGLLFLLFHTVTWFNLAPKAVVLRIRGRRVPDWAVAGANYAAWVLLSAAVAAILLGA
ncbi:MAG TPA: fumarate reductase subunit C [Vicinamibacteria bacterium]|nr:fumarate reductase subunit C [Vicinamibacteria bacterium]